MYPDHYHNPRQTGQAIGPDQMFADVAPRRALAWIIDTVLIAAMTTVLIPLTGFIALFFLGGLYLAVSFLYRWIGLSRASGTLGMRLLGLTFRDRQGQPIDGVTAFLHTLGYTLSVAFVFPQIISVFLMTFTRAHQGISDIVLGTALVNRAALD